MTPSWTQKEAHEVMTEVVRRATTDADFRRLALSDPGKAIQAVAGKPLPPGMNVKLFDGAGAALALVLPALKGDTSELTDQELDQVAGGRCPLSCLLSCAVSSTATGPIACP